jgi:hypothetical protein
LADKTNWPRFVAKVKRQLQENRVRKQEESPADRAARRTANATIALAYVAIFTLVAAIITGYFIFQQFNAMEEANEVAGFVANKARYDAKANDVATAKQFAALQSEIIVAQETTKEARRSADAAIGESRAWMVPVENGKVKEGSVSVLFKNIGRSPAIQVRAMDEAVFDMEKYGPPGTPAPIFGSCDHLLRKQGGFHQAPIVLPDGTFEVQLPLPYGIPKSDAVSVATSHGCMWYTDVLSGQRR